jgi:hypothetical protein
VFIRNGIFYLNGGTISNNTANTVHSRSYTGGRSYGGGVAARTGTIIMTGGSIDNNSSSGTGDSHGGGLFVAEGVFNMYGGIVSRNKVEVSATGMGTKRAWGGGVWINTYNLYQVSGKRQQFKRLYLRVGQRYVQKHLKYRQQLRSCCMQRE